MSEIERIAAAEAALYVGSPEHKMPTARSDASLCPPEMEGMQDVLTGWLKECIRAGRIGGPVEGRFPRYVWCRQQNRWFAGRLTNQTLGHYKGYPIMPEEAPQELRSSNEV